MTWWQQAFMAAGGFGGLYAAVRIGIHSTQAWVAKREKRQADREERADRRAEMRITSDERVKLAKVERDDRLGRLETRVNECEERHKDCLKDSAELRRELIKVAREVGRRLDADSTGQHRIDEVVERLSQSEPPKVGP